MENSDETTPLLSGEASSSTAYSENRCPVSSIEVDQSLGDGAVDSGYAHSSSINAAPVINIDHAKMTRKPFHVNRVGGAGDATLLFPTCDDDDSVATYSRYMYYSKLHQHQHTDGADALVIPHHILPKSLLATTVLPTPLTEESRQSSLITIFALWNTMMGTSILSMPWGIQQSGFGAGVAIMAAMMAICLYTAYRVVRLEKNAGFLPGVYEFQDLCRILLGRWAEIASVVFSLSALLGAVVVYWVLISNFLYSTVAYVHDSVSKSAVAQNVTSNTTHHDVLCPSGLPENTTQLLLTADGPQTSFDAIWNLHLTVPLYLVFIVGPVVCIKSPTFFTKFNALGALCVLYMAGFVSYKAWTWGINFDFSQRGTEFEWSFPALSGILSLAYFIHNCIVPILRNQEKPENNTRDLVIVYVLVMSTYVFIGVAVFVSFPLDKSCIQDNFLNNFGSSDPLAFVCRLFLLLQLFTVCPLVMYLLRIQILYVLFRNIYPSFKHVVVLNAILIAICILFAIFMPSIGTIIRFTGAFSGLAFIFVLPCLAYMAALRKKGRLTPLVGLVHIGLICIGIANFVAQFITV